MKDYLLRLNWKAFIFVLLLMMIGALANKNCNSLIEWLILVIIIGLPTLIFVLFAGMKRKNKDNTSNIE